MSDNPAFGFGKFVPGFDFLQTLSQSAARQAGAHAAPGGSASGVPDWSQWVAPTLQVEEIDKRIGELRTVQFWLEQNARALAATIQALEVQKMTLDTLKGMNLQMSDLAGAFGFKGAAAGPAAAPEPAARGSGPYDDMFTAGRSAAPPAPTPAASASGPYAQPAPPAAPAAEPEPAPAATAPPATGASAPPAPAGGAGVVDPLQWWNALTGQFQQIAATAMQEAAQQARSAPGAHLAEAARQAFAASGERATGKVVAGKRAAAKAPAAARKAAGSAAGGTARKSGTAAKPARTQPATKAATKAASTTRGRSR